MAVETAVNADGSLTIGIDHTGNGHALFTAAAAFVGARYRLAATANRTFSTAPRYPGPKIAFASAFEINRGAMKLLSEEKSKILADRHGWPIAHAQGYVAGEASRRLNEVPSTYALVGIDDYALGFRAGYFVRQSPRSTYATNLDSQLVPGQLRRADL